MDLVGLLLMALCVTVVVLIARSAAAAKRLEQLEAEQQRHQEELKTLRSQLAKQAASKRGSEEAAPSLATLSTRRDAVATVEPEPEPEPDTGDLAAAMRAAKKEVKPSEPPSQATPPPLPRHRRKEPSTATLPTARPAEASLSAPASAMEAAKTQDGDASAPASSPSESPPTRPRKPIPWQAILERLQLWPPSREGEAAEVRLAVWWSTRIGSVLLVIASVFFAIYVSRDNPWLRLAGLAVTSLFVTGVGQWLERRFEAFGRVVSAAGLALSFVTAFSAGALPATRVIESPALAVFLQAVAVAGILGWSLWKRAEGIAVMALICGYIACAFSYAHDLGHFVLSGLFLLAIAGCLLSLLRAWFGAGAVSLGGSWSGLLLLVSFAWPGDPPPSALLIGSLLGLPLLFELAGATVMHRQPDSLNPTAYRSALLGNTSAAALAVWLAGHLIVPDLRATLYLLLSLLILGFSAWHYLRSKDTGLTQVLFLKSMGFLALFVIARFDGPVTWVSLAAQSGVLLFTWRHTGYRFVEWGWGVLTVLTLGWISFDLFRLESAEWTLLSARNLAAVLALLLLTASVALHARFSRPSDAETPEPWGARRYFRLLIIIAMVLICGILAVYPGGLDQLNRVWFLVAAGLVLVVPAPLLRQFQPVLVGVPTFLLGSLIFLFIGSDLAESQHGVIQGTVIVLLSLLIAEGVYMRWPRTRRGGALLRALGYSAALLVGTRTFLAADDLYAWGPATRVTALLLASAFGAAVLLLHGRAPLPHQGGSRPDPVGTWIVSGLIGILLSFLGLVFREDLDWLVLWLGLVSLPLLATCFRLRRPTPALAAAPVLSMALGSYLLRAVMESPPWTEQLPEALGFAAILSTIAVVLWRCADPARFRCCRLFEGLLQAASVLTLTVFFLEQFEIAGAFTAAGLLSLVLMLVARSFHYTTPAALAFLPVVLTGLAQLGRMSWAAEGGIQPLWLLSAGLLFVLQFLSLSSQHGLARPSEREGDRRTDVQAVMWVERATPFFVGPLACVALSASLPEAWSSALTVVPALYLLMLWRFRDLTLGHAASILPLSIGALVAARHTFAANPDGHPFVTLLSISIFCLGLLAHGWILCTRSERARFVPLTNLHAIVALVLSFCLYASSEVGVGKLITVAWGCAAIVCFVAGLAAGLKPYRLVGLAGLGICILRMFLVDIDDTLYRIVAFFAISLALLGIGFLYSRFRDRIAALDAAGPRAALPASRVESQLSTKRRHTPSLRPHPSRWAVAVPPSKPKSLPDHCLQLVGDLHRELGDPPQFTDEAVHHLRV